MASCAAPELNLTATERHDSTMRELGGVRERLARQTWTAQEEIRQKRAELARDTLAVDEARAAASSKAAELTEELRVLKTMEEDLIAARRRHVAAAAELAQLKEAEARVATLAERLAKLQAEAKTLAAQVATEEQASTAQQAAVAARRAALAPALDALGSATQALDAALAALAAITAPATEAPATKK